MNSAELLIPSIETARAAATLAVNVLAQSSLIIAVGLTLAGCGLWQGDKVVETEPQADAIGKGPGLFTGKRGAIILYER